MMDKEKLEAQLAELPLYWYHFFSPEELEFSDRIRWICENECPMYGKSWASPPGVGEVSRCMNRCKGYQHCLMVATLTEVSDIANIPEALNTRHDHENITNTVREIGRASCRERV